MEAVFGAAVRCAVPGACGQTHRTRLPDQAPEPPWTYGTDVVYLRDLLGHWQNGFDWRAKEAALNASPQFHVLLDGIDLHVLHVCGEGPAPMPLLLSHGWPGSVFEFLDLIPRLTQPSRFAGDAADAFTMIAPSLPGCGLSFAADQQRFSMEAIADCLAELMTEVLAYRRFAAQGGDWRASVASRLGVVHAAKLIGIHLNRLTVRHDPTMLADPTEEERRYLGELTMFLKEETGSQWIQDTRPQTLAYGLTDSLTGLAAWIAEKFRAWTDNDGTPDSAVDRDTMLAAGQVATTGTCLVPIELGPGDEITAEYGPLGRIGVRFAHMGTDAIGTARVAAAALETVVFRSRSTDLPAPAPIDSVEVGEWTDRRPCGCGFPPSARQAIVIGAVSVSRRRRGPDRSRGAGVQGSAGAHAARIRPVFGCRTLAVRAVRSSAACRRPHAHGVPAGPMRRARGTTRMRSTPPATSDRATLTA